MSTATLRPISGLIFDYGGVLWNMRLDVARAIEVEHGLPERSILTTMYGTETWRKLQIGIGEPEAWLKSSHAELERVAGRALPPLHQQWRDQQHLVKPNIELVRRARTRYRTGVLSNAARTLRTRLKDTHAIWDLFDDVVCSADVGMAKPDGAIYALAAEGLGLPPASCVFIDDSPQNVEAAREAGMQAVLFRIDLGDVLSRQLSAMGVDL